MLFGLVCVYLCWWACEFLLFVFTRRCLVCYFVVVILVCAFVGAFFVFDSVRVSVCVFSTVFVCRYSCFVVVWWLVVVGCVVMCV